MQQSASGATVNRPRGRPCWARTPGGWSGPDSADWSTHVIDVRGLTKRYGSTVAVDGLSFEVASGRVTGFLGPNGAGKSTTMRLILGLDTPNAGTATINGTSYRGRRFPMHEVGALLDAQALHPGRSAFHHLLSLAQSNR